MEEARRQLLQGELEQALRERDRLNVVVAYLSERLGIEEPASDGGETAPTEQALATATEAADAVREGQFYGMSGPKAAKELLRMFGRTRPMKTDEIYAAIKKGGVGIGSSGTLYRSMFRDDDFHKVGRGVWGLSEWYPNASKQTKTEGQDESDEQIVTAPPPSEDASEEESATEQAP